MDDPSVLASLLSRRKPLSSPYVTPSNKEVDRAMNIMEIMEKERLASLRNSPSSFELPPISHYHNQTRRVMQKNIEEQRLRGVSAYNLINKGYLMPTNTLTEDNKRMMFLRAGYPEEEIRAAIEHTVQT